MLKCHYPNCRQLAKWTPVVILPMNLRTPAINKPVMSPYIGDQMALRRRGFNPHQIIRQYEDALADYKATHETITARDEPLYLLGKEVCQLHRSNYNFFQWFKASEWEYLREAARAYGYNLPPGRLFQIEFRPLGWKPPKASSKGRPVIELTRDRVTKESV